MRDEDQLVVDPPPLPASHPTQKDRWRDSLRIPFQFYVEAFVSQLLLLIVVFLAQHLVPMFAGVAIFGQPLLWFWLVWRLAKRVLEARRARGKPRPEATALFLAALLLPMVILLLLARQMLESRRHFSHSVEARTRLRGIYGAERRFKKDFGRYTLSVTELSTFQRPEGEQPYYALGFATACAVKSGVAKEKAQWPVADPTHLRDKRTEIEAVFLGIRSAFDCKDPVEGFEAFAVGRPKEDGPLDVWVIDERGQLRNL